MIGNWSFFAAALVFVFGVVPLLPLVFAPPGTPGRRVPMALWMAFSVVVAAGIPWDTAIESNGMRIVAILVFVGISAFLAIGIHGAAPSLTGEAATVQVPSPDLVGIDGPLLRSDAIDAGRALGIDEAVFAQIGRPGGAS